MPGCPTMSAEARLIYALAGISSGGVAHAPSSADEAFSWASAIDIAERERAITVLHDQVKFQAGHGRMHVLPADQRARLERLTVLNALRMSHLEIRLNELLQACTTAGIPVMLLKGAALAVTVYPSFTRRPMADLDLLVPAERATEAWDLATRSGWRKATIAQLDPFYAVHHHLPTLEDIRGTGLGLEIHTALFPRDNPFDLCITQLWQRARTVDLRGHIVFVPDDRDMLLHLCTHFAWTHALLGAGWRTFRDISTLQAAGRVDWDDVSRQLRGTPAATCCYWTLRLGRTLAALAVPEQVLAALAPPLPRSALDAIERYYVARLCPPHDWDSRTARLPKLLWSLGIQPRWSGHGDSRPWAMSELFVEYSPRIPHDGADAARRTDGQATLAARGRQLWRELRVLAP